MKEVSKNVYLGKFRSWKFYKEQCSINESLGSDHITITMNAGIKNIY